MRIQLERGEKGEEKMRYREKKKRRAKKRRRTWQDRYRLSEHDQNGGFRV